MKLNEVYAIADALAPITLSEEYCRQFGAYDNSGILVDTGEAVTGIVFSLDLSNAAIKKAVSIGANLIITHHPAIYGKIGDIRVNDETLLGEKLVRCIRHGISVLSMHLNLDVAKDGIDESLMQGIVDACGETRGAGTRSIEKMHVLSNGAYGRVYDVSPIELSTLKENLKKTFSSERIVTYGEKNKKITRVASFCGAGADEETVVFAKNKGADVIISSDFKHHILALALESGLSVIAQTHYASENYGFEKFYKKIRQAVDIPCVWHTDNELL